MAHTAESTPCSPRPHGICLPWDRHQLKQASIQAWGCPTSGHPTENASLSPLKIPPEVEVFEAWVGTRPWHCLRPGPIFPYLAIVCAPVFFFVFFSFGYCLWNHLATVGGWVLFTEGSLRKLFPQSHFPFGPYVSHSQSSIHG